MKKATWIALGLLAALVGIYFAVEDEPVEELESPLVIEPVEGLNRIEIVPPDSGDDVARPDLIVFEKAEKQWTLTSPVETDIQSSFSKKLDEAFSQTIRTDDFELSSDKKDEYGLSEDSGVRVSLYAREADTPAVEMLVGEQITVPQTGVERTYISKVGDDGIYRAQIALGELMRKPLDEVRSKSILELDREGISSVEITHPDGTTITLARDKTEWTLARDGEAMQFELDESRLDNAMRTYAGLRATGFYDPGESETDALPDPEYKVVIDGGGQTHTLAAGKTSGAGGDAFVRRSELPFAYKIDSRSFDALTADAQYFRTRTPQPIERDTIQRIEFRADATIVVEKSDDTWTLTRPSSDDFNAARAKSLVSTLSNLRVHGYPPLDADTTMDATVGRVDIETNDRTFQLTLGEQATTEDGVALHLARFDDGPLFYLDKPTVDRLTPSLDDLEGGAALERPAKLPKGMPQKLPKGMKLPPGLEK